MAKLVVGIVDVFADAALRGNPLAVVEGAEGLTDETLRLIAREFNQAETTFLLPSTRADWKLRSFTANGSEIFGAGHNALGAWLWLADRGLLGDLAEPRLFHQEIGGDVLPITLHGAEGWVEGRMVQAPLTLSSGTAQIEPLASALNLDPALLLQEPAPRVADTGAAHLMVRVRDAASVDDVRADAEALLSVLGALGAEGCYVYAFDPIHPETAYARFVNPTVGLWEDSATGTAAGPLCAYLGSQGLLNADSALIVEQGVRMGRRSFLSVRLTPAPELSGSGVVVLRGELDI